eukprot:1162098-Pelagomonas_calceolata.AAC.7
MNPCSCVPYCNILLVPGVLRKGYFLVDGGLWIVVAKVGMSDGSKFTTEMCEQCTKDELLIYGVGMSRGWVVAFSIDCGVWGSGLYGIVQPLLAIIAEGL